jgi:hypothetical protein
VLINNMAIMSRKVIVDKVIEHNIRVRHIYGGISFKLP